MIYNHLVYLLIVILILTTGSIPEAPRVPPGPALFLFLLKGMLFRELAHHTFRPGKIWNASGYFAAEQKLSILAIILFAIDIYLLEIQYYLAALPLTGQLPALASLGGLLLFFAYLAVLWLEARPSYQAVFHRSYSPRAFLLANFKIILPVILPWLLLTIFFDLLRLLPYPSVVRFLASPWGEPAVFLLFFLMLAVSFPLLVVRLWGCTPLPAGATRDHIETICRRERLAYREILVWPLFEGRILTAGIMGLTRHFRYLLITPSLLEAIDPEEMEAVIAHEIGHVKKFHLQLYLLLFFGFGLLAQLSSYPLLSLILGSELFYQVVRHSGIDPGAALGTAGILSIFLFMILYFRFLFGFFMRNFERQADLHAFTTLGESAPLIRVLEKIGWLSGNIRDLPSWHHYGIAQRVDYLLKCQQDRKNIARHHLKVYGALLLYLAVLGSGSLLLWRLPPDPLTGPTREKFAAAIIEQKIKSEPGNPFWHQLRGDLEQGRHRYGEAIGAYEQALALAPEDPVVQNNLAWLLLTSEDHRFRDPARALALAREAAARQPEGFVLDTLASAYWANGYADLAIQTEEEAIRKDPANREYYQSQLEKFRLPEEKTGTGPPASFLRS